MPDAAELQGVGDAAYYEKWYGRRAPEFYAPILGQIVRFGRPGSILDLGCGVGLLLELAARWGLVATGCDGSTAAVEAASRRVPAVQVTQCLMSDRLPFDDGRFANVVLNEVIGCLPPAVQRHVVLESRRVLTPGGMLFLFSTSRAHTREVARYPTLRYPLLPSELRALLTSAGFVVVQEPGVLRFERIAVLRPVLRILAKTPLLDRLSRTANAYARRA